LACLPHPEGHIFGADLGYEELKGRKVTRATPGHFQCLSLSTGHLKLVFGQLELVAAIYN
jgi:hypothetical protein